MPAARASSIAYWISGLSTTGNSSLASDLVAGKNLVPRPATGSTAFFNAFVTRYDPLRSPPVWDTGP